MEKLRKQFEFQGWKLPKRESSLAPPGVWTNIDNDVTPRARRTWNIWMIVGFWASDYLSMQSFENPSSALSVGLSWREALVNSIVGMIIIGIPLVLNGAMGAALHIPFAVCVRSSFGYYFARFAIVTRLTTALFWHAIQTYSGSMSMWLLISSIWPSFLTMKNHIPESFGITSAQMVGHFVFWSIQFPFMLIAPHKLKWFFIMKGVIVTACLIGMASGIAKMSGGTGEVWHLKAEVHGSEKSWLQLTTLMSAIGGWATMATNISDFTRYMKDKSNAQYVQVAVIPSWATFVSMMALICSSAGKLIYGEYIWSPTSFCVYWIQSGSKGRAASFFVCLSWCIAQIGTNLSANVITAANDLTSLFPRYLNIRRSAMIVTIVAGWVMQPWKIINSAASLINFMSGVSLFLAPIFTIMITDYWLVKKQKIDVPALYDPNGIYRYQYGTNWRAAVAFLCSLVPNLPGLAQSVNSSITLSEGSQNFASISYLYGFSSAFVVFYALNYFFPDRTSLIEKTVLGEDMEEFDNTNTSTSNSVESVSVAVDVEKPLATR